MATEKKTPEDGAHAQQPIRVFLKRATLLLTSALVAGVTTALMVACAHDGVRVESFEATTKDQHARKQLIDAYNSYSGNAVSLLLKPVELFLAMVVAVGLLCFATDFSTGTSDRNTNSAVRFDRVLVTGTAAACYLLTNGFNALNVQLSPRPIEPAITAQDLSLRASESSVTSPLVAYTEPERTPFLLPSDKRFMEEYDGNPLTNTILRNAFVPIELNPSPQCTLSHVAATTESRRDGTVASYGFPARPWHHDALKRALKPTQSLKIAVIDNSTKSPKVILSTGGNGTLLPVSTQQAVKLLVQSIAMTELMLPWWEFSYLSELISDNVKGKYEPLVARKESELAVNDTRSALLSDLLFQPSTNARNKTLSTREFLMQAKQTLFNFFSRAPNASTSELQVEFTRIANVAQGVMFDSLTIEIPLRKNHLQREYVYNSETLQYEHRTTNTSSSSIANGSAVIYYDIDQDDECSRDACVLSEPEYAYNGDESFIEPQVHALGVCVDEDGREDPRVQIEYRNVTYDSDPIRLYPTISCKANSNASMYTVSVGKRVQGDAMTTRVLHDDPQHSYKVLRLSNARKIYSITITHISWELQELTKTYGAKCKGNGTGGDQKANLDACRGLWCELEPADSQAKTQHLVVGGCRLPLALLSGYSPQHRSFLPEIHDATRLTPLVSKLMRRPATASPFRKQLVYDLVYPRRFGKADWPSKMDAATSNCSAWAEDHIHYTESNHLYMERTLQPSYAAGFFFLFQDAVVRDVVATQSSSEDGRSYAHGSVILNFVGNTQWIDVNISSPMPNVVLTLVGAALLLIASVAIGVFGGKVKERELQSIMTAHSVAELLIADKKYPPLLVGMTIASSNNNGAAVDLGTDKVMQQQEVNLPVLPAPTKADSLRRFRIEALSLVRQGDDEETGRCVDFPRSTGVGALNNPRDFV